MEQNLYESEGITISATAFKDNQVTLDLLEAKIVGVFSMCDEEINVPRGSDDGMLQKLLQKHGDGKHPNMIRPKPNICKDYIKCFGILHYAGPVYYNINGFLEKNKDQLHPEIIGVLKQSTSPMLQKMFPGESASSKDVRRGSSTTKSAAKTLGSQFKNQLNDLIATLNSTFPHFVRCMKPNDDKAGNKFTASRMQDQLRYAGLVEVCRIRKQGYPVRREFEAFYKRYRSIVLSSSGIDDLLAGMAEKGILKDGEWQKGHTKIFMRTKQSQELEFAREHALLSVAKSIQRSARGFLMRVKYKNYLRLLQTVRDGIAKREEKALTEAIDNSFELPYGGGHLAVIQEAKLLQTRLREERRVLALLENAISARKIDALRSAVAAALGMVPPYEPAVLTQANALIERLELEQETKNMLLVAIAARDRQQLILLLAKAADLDLDCVETRQATALKARLDEEELALDNLKQAVLGRVLVTLTACIDKCTEMGLETPDVTAARSLQARLQLELQAINSLVAATLENDIDVINVALDKALALGLSPTLKEIVAAKEAKKYLETVHLILTELESSTDSRNLSAVEASIAKAEAQNMKPEKYIALQSAYAMRDTLKAEIAAMDGLLAAMKSENIDALSSALSEIGRLGLDGPKVTEARAMAKALGAQNEARDRLAAIAASESLEEVEAGLAEATRLGLLHTPEAAAVIARRSRLEEEIALAREIQQLTLSANITNHQELSRLVATAMRMGLSTKHMEVLNTAKSKVKRLGEEVKVTVQIQQALLSNDLAALKESYAYAASLNVDTSFADKKRAELEAKAVFVEKIDRALQVKDVPLLTKLLAEADELDVKGDKVTQARMLIDRTALIAKIHKSFAEARISNSLSDLDEALKMAIELGLDSPEVTEAQALRTWLEVLEGVKSQLSAAEQVVAVKVESGLVLEDLEPIKAVIAHAKSVCFKL